MNDNNICVWTRGIFAFEYFIDFILKKYTFNCMLMKCQGKILYTHKRVSLLNPRGNSLDVLATFYFSLQFYFKISGPWCLINIKNQNISFKILKCN